MKNLIISLAAILAFALPAAAADTLFVAPGETDAWSVDVRAMQQYEADVKSGGTMTVSEFYTNLLYARRMDNAVQWRLGFWNRYFSVEGDGNVDLPGQFVGRSMVVGGGVPVPLMDDPDFTVNLDLVPSYYTDSVDDSFGNFETGAFRWPVRFYFTRYVNPDLWWTVGFIYRTDHFSQDLIHPVLGLNWRFHENWVLWSDSFETQLRFEPNRNWAFFISAEYQLDEFEVERDGAEGRVLRYSRNTSGAGIAYTPNENVRLVLGGGAVYNRSYEYTDGVGKVLTDSGFYTDLRLSLLW